MTRQLAQLVIGSLLLWVLLAVPAWLLGGARSVLETVAAGGLCLAPMVLTMIWCHHAFRGSSEQQLLAVLGGTGARMIVVLAGGIGLYRAVEWLHRPAFLLWVIVFYLTTLALEITLVVRRQNAALAAGNQN